MSIIIMIYLFIDVYFQVKVIIGEERESIGSLLSIDSNDGVVKLDRGTISMLQLSHLCRMPTDSD